jgi:hypothetical protein
MLAMRYLMPLLLLPLVPPVHGDDWPCWRGPHRDGISRETGLLKVWPKDGPAQLWKVDLSGGFSSVAVVEGRLFTQTREKSQEIVLCLEAATGRELWRYRYDCRGRRAGAEGRGDEAIQLGQGEEAAQGSQASVAGEVEDQVQGGDESAQEAIAGGALQEGDEFGFEVGVGRAAEPVLQGGAWHAVVAGELALGGGVVGVAEVVACLGGCE